MRINVNNIIRLQYVKPLIIFLIVCISFGCSRSNNDDTSGRGSISSYTEISTNYYCTDSGLYIDAYKIIYETIGTDGSTIQTASGALLIPKLSSGYPTTIEPFLYLHGTITQRSHAPSQSSNNLYQGHLIACNNFITIMPDYLGLGDDTTQMHPYHHASSTLTATIDMIRASETFLGTEYSIDMDTNLYITGFSQGGYATMIAHKGIQEEYASEYTVTASFPSSGAYDLSGTMLDLALTSTEPMIDTDDTFGDQLGIYYFPYVLLTMNSIYTLYDDINSVFIESLSSVGSYYDMVTDEDTINTFINTNLVNNGLSENLIQDIFQDSYLSAVLNDDNHDLRVALEYNDAYKWIPETKMVIISCDGDNIVPSANATVAYNYMIDNGADSEVVRLEILSADSHNACFEPSINQIYSELTE